MRFACILASFVFVSASIAGVHIDLIGRDCCPRYPEQTCILDVELRMIASSQASMVYQGQELEHLVNENTIGVVCTVGITQSLCFDDVSKVNDKLKKIAKKTGLDIPIHVDAASGGFVAPFAYPKFKWDFRLEHVAFINISSHK